MRRVTVRVTQENIDKSNEIKAIKNRPIGTLWKCPIDLAIVDAGIYGWHTAATFLYRYEGFGQLPSSSREKVMLPFTAQAFVEDLDNGLDVSPIEFVVEMPE